MRDEQKYCLYLPLSLAHWKLIKFIDDETFGQIVRAALEYCVKGGGKENVQDFDDVGKGGIEPFLYESLIDAADNAHEAYMQKLEASARGVQRRLEKLTESVEQPAVNQRSTSGQPADNQIKRKLKEKKEKKRIEHSPMDIAVRAGLEMSNKNLITPDTLNTYIETLNQYAELGRLNSEEEAVSLLKYIRENVHDEDCDGLLLHVVLDFFHKGVA